MLHKLKVLPHEFDSLNEEEQDFIIASILYKVESDKKELDKIK